MFALLHFINPTEFSSFEEFLLVSQASGDLMEERISNLSSDTETKSLDDFTRIRSRIHPYFFRRTKVVVFSSMISLSLESLYFPSSIFSRYERLIFLVLCLFSFSNGSQVTNFFMVLISFLSFLFSWCRKGGCGGRLTASF